MKRREREREYLLFLSSLSFVGFIVLDLFCKDVFI